MEFSLNSSASIFVLAPPLVRWGLERLLRSSGFRLTITGASSSLAEAASQLEALYPDAVVVDLEHYAGEDISQLQGTCGGIVALLPGGKGGNSPECVCEVVTAYVHTRTAPAAFIRTVLQVASAGRPTCDAVASQRPQTRSPEVTPGAPDQAAAWQPEALTPKQREIVRAVTLHASAPAKVIAAKLHISEHTLRNHLSEIYSRLGVSRRTHLQAIVTATNNAFATETRLSLT